MLGHFTMSHHMVFMLFSLFFYSFLLSVLQSECFLLICIAEFTNFLCLICDQTYLFKSSFHLLYFSFLECPFESFFYTFHSLVTFSSTSLNIFMTALLKSLSNYSNIWITCCSFHCQFLLDFFPL